MSCFYPMLSAVTPLTVSSELHFLHFKLFTRLIFLRENKCIMSFEQ